MPPKGWKSSAADSASRSLWPRSPKYPSSPDYSNDEEPCTPSDASSKEEKASHVAHVANPGKRAAAMSDTKEEQEKKAAPATAAAFSSVEAPRKKQRVEESAAAAPAAAHAVPTNAAAPAHALDEACECCVCTHAYATAPPAVGADHRPRMLMCGHGVCTDCAARIINDGAITCPECREQRSILLPGGVAAAALTKADWAALLPLNRDLVKSIKSQQSAAFASSLPRCIISACKHASTLHCCDCAGGPDQRADSAARSS